MDFPIPPPPVFLEGGGAVEFLFGAFIALSCRRRPSSSSSSWPPPAPPRGCWPPSSGRRWSRSPRDLPENMSGETGRWAEWTQTGLHFVLTISRADAHLVFLWARLPSSWGEVQCGETGKAKRLKRLKSVTKISLTKQKIKGLKPEYSTEVPHDSPADFIWRWHIIGCGIHLGDDNVGITSDL